jgi:RNA polymerase sigma factor (sigma-70 family)
LATEKHLVNFLYLVTRNGCISHLRTAQVAQTTEREWVRISAEEMHKNTALDLERVQTRLMDVVFEKLSQLPGGDILRMSYLEGKSTKEIAEQLQISENNVYIMKSRSLKSLRNMLTKNEWMLFVLIFLKW